MPEWIRACSLKELENSFYSFDHGQKRVLLAKVQGKVCATDRTCTHEDADLSCGFATPEGVRCNLHLSVFDMRTGEPQNPPADRPLSIYNTRVDGDEVHVEL